MPTIVQMALSNAVLVTAATPLVWLIGRLARRPVLTHSLWLILLFKLITPPLWTLGVGLPQPHPVAQAPPVATPAPETIARAEVQTADAPVELVSPPVEDVVISSPPSLSIAAPAAAVATPAAPAPRIEPVNWRAMVIPGLGIIWLAGAMLCLCLAVFRLIRFTRALGWAAPASAAVQARADALARSVGLERAPNVQFVPGPLCPMLWPVGRSARLLLPAALWDRLDSVQRDTVLLHELAHFARRDHWVRWAELLATSLYWWLPACWIARKELRRAEEQCCDAWVLWALPGAFQHYAHALLQTVEFVSVPADRSSALRAAPALASGMGQFSDLKGRLTMLKQGNVSRALSFGGMIVVFGLGALLLPISPTIGQDAGQSVPAADQPKPTGSADAAPTETSPDLAPKDVAPKATTEPQNPKSDTIILSKDAHLDRPTYQKLDDMKLLPAQDATDAEYVRRLYLDLLGEAPSPDRVKQFVDDPAPSADKRKVLLDKLLAFTTTNAQEKALRESQERVNELIQQLNQANAQIVALKAQFEQTKQGNAYSKKPWFNGIASDPRTVPQGTRSTFGPLNGNKYGGAGAVAAASPEGQMAGPLPGAGPSIGLPGINNAGAAYVAGNGNMATPSAEKTAPVEPDNSMNSAFGRGRATTDTADRLDRLEAELKTMLKEIDSLRAERQGERTVNPPPAPEVPTAK